LGAPLCFILFVYDWSWFGYLLGSSLVWLRWFPGCGFVLGYGLLQRWSSFDGGDMVFRTYFLCLWLVMLFWYYNYDWFSWSLVISCHAKLVTNPVPWILDCLLLIGSIGLTVWLEIGFVGLFWSTSFFYGIWGVDLAGTDPTVAPDLVRP